MNKEERTRAAGTGHWSRRDLGRVVAGLAVVGCAPKTPEPAPESTSRDWSSLESEVAAHLEASQVPGFAGGLLVDNELVWARGFGVADLESGAERTERTLQNVGSVTKTATATLILRLAEQGRLDLDADVADVLSFPVRNPRFPDVSITARQLLTHRSSILDGAPYEESYACGDAAVELGAWLESYFTAADLEPHFHVWSPGELTPPESPRAYSNVAYGLLGHLAERVTGRSYSQALRELVLEPLGMSSSGVLLSEIDVASHASLYSRLPEDADLERPEKLLLADPPWPASPAVGDLVKHCLYSFGTPPDGLLRSNVVDLAQLLRLYIGRGEIDGRRVLEASTVADALRPAHFGRALCWDLSELDQGENFWNHSGGDPGVATLIAFRELQRSGFILLFNGADVGESFGAIVQTFIRTLDAVGGGTGGP